MVLVKELIWVGDLNLFARGAKKGQPTVIRHHGFPLANDSEFQQEANMPRPED